jgi:DNA-binding FadR family transcriptional regulator
MSAPSGRRYRVVLDQHSVLVAMIDAKSDAAARRAAMALWEERGDAAFEMKQCDADVSFVDRAR